MGCMTEQKEPSYAYKLFIIALSAINAFLDWLNYTAGNPNFERSPDGKYYYYTPSWDDPAMRQKYFHRCTFRGCGCGYDGLWIYPVQCPTLRDDIKSGRYQGY